jgi:hypothetical protein
MNNKKRNVISRDVVVPKASFQKKSSVAQRIITPKSSENSELVALIQFRRGSSTEWFEKDPVLDSGEPGFEEDTGKFKIGDGVKTWNNLQYSNTVGLDGLLATVQELNRLHNVTLGIATGGKVLVVDGDKNLNFNGGNLILNNLTVEGLLDIEEVDGGTP